MGATEAEMQAAEAARKTLWNAFLQQRIRLRGHLEGNLPADIDPLEMRQGGIKIFEGILEVYAAARFALTTMSIAMRTKSKSFCLAIQHAAGEKRGSTGTRSS